MNKSVKDALILCLITLVAGLLLGGVYEITKNPREKQEEKAKNEAYMAVFNDAKDFETLKINDMSKIDAALKKNNITSKNVIIDEIAAAKDASEKIIGYVVNVTSKEGFGGDISFSVGVNLDGTINGVSILTISETAGLGMNATNKEFLNQYTLGSAGLFVVNKDEAAKGNNIDAISGATITTKAMTKGVNAAKIAALVIIGESEVQ